MSMRFSQGGISMGAGVTGSIADTLPFSSRAMTAEPAAAGGEPVGAAGGTMPHVTLIGFFGLLALIWLAQKINSHFRDNSLPVSIANFVIIGLTSISSILVAKVVVNRFVPLPNVVEAVNAA